MARPNVADMTRAVKRAWIPLLVVVVLAVSGLVVSRLHKIFGSQDLNANAGAGIEIVQFNPKVVTYEVSGAPGTTANINYWDENANTHQVNDADGDQIGCRITVDGVVREQQSANGHNAQTFCLVKSA